MQVAECSVIHAFICILILKRGRSPAHTAASSLFISLVNPPPLPDMKSSIFRLLSYCLLYSVVAFFASVSDGNARTAVPSESVPAITTPGTAASIKISFSEPTIDSSKPIYDALYSNPDIQDFIQSISDLFVLPRPIEIHAEDCTEETFPAPSSSLPIHLCYGLIAQTALIDNGMPEDAQKAQIVASALYSVLNYLAPVLASQFDLKVGEGDTSALPELSAVLALSVGDAIKPDMLEALARTAQDIASAEENQEIKPYWILSGISKAQADTVACMIYGSDPARFSDLSVDEDAPSRDMSCDALFSQKMEYWSSQLEGHYRK